VKVLLEGRGKFWGPSLQLFIPEREGGIVEEKLSVLPVLKGEERLVLKRVLIRGEGPSGNEERTLKLQATQEKRSSV